MSKRFGKKRVPNCECTASFSCRACLDAGVLIGMSGPVKRDVKAILDDPKLKAELLAAAVDFICKVEGVR
jgi:hypothetical protein